METMEERKIKPTPTENFSKDSAITVQLKVSIKVTPGN
jgi:hypothetical protein